MAATKKQPKAVAPQPDQARKQPSKTTRNAKAVSKASSPEVESLKAEILALRKTLAEKTALFRSLGGSLVGGETDTVRKILELLRRTQGATKRELVEATGAKKGYVDALLNRILPGKGYEIEGQPREGGRVKAYRFPTVG